MKLLTHIFSFVYFLTFTCVHAESNNESSIAAIVNDKSILISELNNRVKLLLLTSESKPSAAELKSIRKQVLDQMIDEILQLQTMKTFDIKVDGPEIDIAWGTIEKRMGLGQGQLNNLLKEKNIPAKVIMNQIRSSLGWQQYIMEKHGRDVQVSDAEVQAELAQQESKKKKNEALLSEIVIPYENDTQKEEARSKAQSILAKIKAGEAFPKLAQEHSQSASASRGGDMGWVDVDTMEPAFKKAIQGKQKSEISAPVDHKNAFHIIGIRDRHGIGSLGESQEFLSFQQIEFKFPMFDGEQGMEETHLKASNIRNSAKTCSMMKKLTDGRPRMKNQSVSNVQIQSLHPELGKILKKLKPGERSELLGTEDGLIMFMMCSRNTVKPYEPDEKDIRKELRERKLTQIYDKELRALRGKAFIDIKKQD